ncbi:hypothetical protein SLS62_009368 [Diatrype stigma]|uniref:Uncharacterized protein n=1 Tax=Diatrype stigma TaxID=117547 RepID=A0AAN9YJM8_9PEZI
MSLDAGVQDESGIRAKSSTTSRDVQEVVQQGIFRLPINPYRDDDEPPKFPVGSGSPLNEDEYDFDYKLDGAASPNRSGYTSAHIPAPLANANRTFRADNEKEQVQEQVKAAVREFMAKKHMADQADTRQHIIELVMPELEWAASEAAKREVGRLIAERAKAETEEEKIATVMSRLNALPSRSLEALFRKRAMVDLLRRVLDKLGRQVDEEG